MSLANIANEINVKSPSVCRFFVFNVIGRQEVVMQCLTALNICYNVGGSVKADQYHIQKYKVHRYLVVVTWGGLLVSEVVPDESMKFNHVTLE